MLKSKLLPYALPAVLLGLAASPVLALAADSMQSSPDECAVWKRELAFAQSVDQHDAAVFATYLHPQAVFNAATGEPARGREQIVRNWTAIIAGKVRLVWRPGHVSVGGDGNVAISRGPFFVATTDTDGTSHYAVGTFTSVWARANAGSAWLVVFDGGGPPPAGVASEAEAVAYVDEAPKTCP